MTLEAQPKKLIFMAGDCLLCLTTDKDLMLIDLEAMTVRSHKENEYTDIQSFSEMKRECLALTAKGTVEIVRIASDKTFVPLRHIIAPEGSIKSLSVVFPGREILYSVMESRGLHIIDTETGASQLVARHDSHKYEPCQALDLRMD